MMKTGQDKITARAKSAEAAEAVATACTMEGGRLLEESPKVASLQDRS